MRRRHTSICLRYRISETKRTGEATAGGLLLVRCMATSPPLCKQQKAPPAAVFPVAAVMQIPSRPDSTSDRRKGQLNRGQGAAAAFGFSWNHSGRRFHLQGTLGVSLGSLVTRHASLHHRFDWRRRHDSLVSFGCSLLHAPGQYVDVARSDSRTATVSSYGIGRRSCITTTTVMPATLAKSVC